MGKTVTISFGNVAENTYGQEKIGQEGYPGFDYKKLKLAARYAKKKYGCDYYLYDLRKLLLDDYDAPEAYVLVIKGLFKDLKKDAKKAFSKNEEKIEEDVIKTVGWDMKEYSTRFGRLNNLRARYKLCFSSTMEKIKRKPKYEKGKGTIYNMKNLPILNSMYIIVKDIVDYSFQDDVELHAEGNYYYDSDKTYIGPHRDRERALTVLCRFMKRMDSHFAWYYGTQRISNIATFSNIEAGDVYIMTEFACGNQVHGKLSVKHAAGDIKLVRKAFK